MFPTDDRGVDNIANSFAVDHLSTSEPGPGYVGASNVGSDMMANVPSGFE
jgi:hypothetical protein